MDHEPETGSARVGEDLAGLAAISPRVPGVPFVGAKEPGASVSTSGSGENART